MHYIIGWCRAVVAVNSPMQVDSRSCIDVFGTSDSKHYIWQLLCDEWHRVSHCPTNWWSFLFHFYRKLRHQLIPVSSKWRNHVHFCSISGCDFSIMVQPILKKTLQFWKLWFKTFNFLCCNLLGIFSSLAPKNGGLSGPTVVGCLRLLCISQMADVVLLSQSTPHVSRCTVVHEHF